MKDDYESLNRIAARSHEIAVEHGFFEGDVDVASICSNLHGEVSELWEAYRKNQLDSPCEKAEKMEKPLTCAEEELADIVIRALDDAVVLGVDIGRAVAVKMAYNETRPYKHGDKRV